MLTPLLALWTAFAAQAPDSAAQARLAAAVSTLRDSLTAVQAAAVAFRADLGTASGDLVLARARRLHQRCAAARRAARPLATLFQVRAHESRPGAAETRARGDLVAVERVLGKCERAYDTAAPGASADTLKAWGPYRISQLEAELRRYTPSIELLAKPAGKR